MPCMEIYYVQALCLPRHRNVRISGQLLWRLALKLSHRWIMMMMSRKRTAKHATVCGFTTGKVVYTRIVLKSFRIFYIYASKMVCEQYFSYINYGTHKIIPSSAENISAMRITGTQATFGLVCGNEDIALFFCHFTNIPASFCQQRWCQGIMISDTAFIILWRRYASVNWTRSSLINKMTYCLFGIKALSLQQWLCFN